MVENAPVDGTRRLVLVRRDDTEHLLLVGTHGDLVIESNIPITKGGAADAGPATGAGTGAGTARRPASPMATEDSGGWPTLRVPGRDKPGQDR